MLSRVQTRQKADLLWETDLPLAAAGVYASPVRRVSGYAEIAFFAVSDQPFGIQIEEAGDVRIASDGQVTGLFTQTRPTLIATLSGSVWIISRRVVPCANFMRTLLGNMGGSDMAELEYVAQGLPLP